MLMRRNRSQVLCIDVQARLAPHIADSNDVVANCGRLLSYAGTLDVPATLTEHYPKGLGATAEPIRAAAGARAVCLQKISFSCWKDAAMQARIATLARAGRDQVIVAGMEAHVCVGQTVIDLLGAGLNVFLVADAVGSRQSNVRDIAIERMRAQGATIVAQEMVAFEWLERGDGPEMKAIIEQLK